MSKPMTVAEANERFCNHCQNEGTDGCYNCVLGSTCSVLCPRCKKSIFFQGNLSDMPLKVDCPYCQENLIREFSYVRWHP
jgi:hypothetical protein